MKTASRVHKITSPIMCIMCAEGERESTFMLVENFFAAALGGGSWRRLRDKLNGHFGGHRIRSSAKISSSLEGRRRGSGKRVAL